MNEIFYVLIVRFVCTGIGAFIGCYVAFKILRKTDSLENCVMDIIMHERKMRREDYLEMHNFISKLKNSIIDIKKEQENAKKR